MNPPQPYLIPEGLPPSTIERPHPVSSGDPSREGSVRPFAALLERVSRNLEGQDAPEPDEPGEEFMAHAAFEAERYSNPTDCAGTLRFADQSAAMWPAVCDVCDFEVCVAIEKFDPAKLIERRLARCGVPDGFVAKTFDSDDPAQQDTLRACRGWLKAFRPGQLAESIPAVALYGKPGRGKTHLLSLLVDTVIRTKNTEALYRSAAALFDELRAGVQDGSMEAIWRRVLNVPVLALDDLAAGRWTEWQADRFAALVDHRYGKALPLLIATNLPPAAWDDVLGERTGSRLRGMCLRFELCGADRRDPAQQRLATP